jgi:hypothetical protein
MDIMVNGQERPWTVSNQIQATVQNTREMLGGMGEQSQALGSAAMHPVATVENVASGIKNGATQLYNDPIAATTLAPDAFSPRNVGKGLVNVAAAEVGGEIVGAVISKAPGAVSAKATTIQANKAAGDAWEKEVIQNQLPATQTSIQPQITVTSNGPSGLNVRLDAVGTDKATSAVKLTDAKASPTAPLTPNQAIVYPELAQHGGTVAGKGKEPYTGGTPIPPTKVDVIVKPKSE